MSNSALISYTKLSPNHSGKRTKKIDTITIHCMAGQLSVESCGALFAQSSRQASSNYGIGNDGRIALYVDEGNRSWCTSSNANDQRAVTIEVASDATHPYAVNSKAYDALLDLVTDICKRNGITKLVWSTNKNERMNHLNGCNMTVHRDYANKACPGDWLYNRHGEIAAEVNRRLGSGSSTPSTGETTGSTADIKIGDVVEFTGTKHYVSSTAKTASSCKPGKAKVTALAKGKAHPYHLIGRLRRRLHRLRLDGRGRHQDQRGRHGHLVPREGDDRRAEHPQGPRHQLRHQRGHPRQGRLHHRRRERRARSLQVGQAEIRGRLDLAGLHQEGLIVQFATGVARIGAGRKP